MELKDESEFNIRSKERGLLQSVCRNCQREQGRERYINDTENVKAINRAARQRSKEEARQFVHAYLSDKTCFDCGESDFSVLTFDHVRGKKKTNISDMISQGYSIASLESELEKTEIVCFNCHMKREQKRRGKLRFENSI
ncbi:MAG TPA: hypothetical protein PKV19_06975 [Anaerolineales bacterium]|nr:hypothetical protein [Anaerolineales bacterium]